MATVTFGGYGFGNIPVTTYMEAGFTVTKVSGTLNSTSGNGNGAPSIFASDAASFNLTNGGTFTFGTFQGANGGFSGTVGYTITGFLNGQQVFTQTYSTGGNNFVTFNSPSSSVVDTVRFDLAGSSVNVDNIVANGTASVLSIGSISQAEGSGGGITNFIFTVTRDNVDSSPTATYTIANGSTNAADFGNGFSGTGTVTFSAGSSTAQIIVPVNADNVAEATENFTVTLSNGSSGVTFSNSTATGTIVNDDTPARQVNGTNGDDLIYALGNGPSTLVGFDGNDTYVVRDRNDVIREFEGGGREIVYSSISYTLNSDAAVENLVAQTATDTTAINLIGNGYNQYVVGNFGNNVLNGNGGVDTLVGLKGDDIYSVSDARAVVLENGGEGNDIVFATVSYKLAAGQEIETLSTQTQGDTAALNMIGNEFAQKVIGNNGANLLDGSVGADTLIGLGGADTFSFSTALGNGNVDTIQDYQAGVDHIQLYNGVFTGLSAGTLLASAFTLGTTAVGTAAQVIYNQATGQLYFDADGTGSGAAVLFATVTSGTALSANDFQVATTVPMP